jgi:hypothetical protein
MSSRGLRKEDEELELKQTPWTQEETDALHILIRRVGPEKLDALSEMLEEYIWAKRFKKKLGWWVAWIVGLPTTLFVFWDGVMKLFKFAGR